LSALNMSAGYILLLLSLIDVTIAPAPEQATAECQMRNDRNFRFFIMIP
jgi:hypothetical protein